MHEAKFYKYRDQLEEIARIKLAASAPSPCAAMKSEPGPPMTLGGAAAAGVHVARCEDCAHTVIAYNSCRNRHCPKCQGAAAKEWLAEREAELLPVGYFHLVFTLPGPIADVAYHNKAAIYGLLFTAAAEAALTIAADPKRLGARIGITAVLHSWGSAMTQNPHS
jgi:hypothetical protein